ncbi:hypothetical protein PR048_017761 [Dryococelus australis]|uniref:Uncharacterized protein n=1 Tax=Dryococelus australis TaxID=614101 RepID=A0ABQ9HAH3_9NEOP|nr:hypothetical protein PR048_017761 [Dryococelus australis]
MHVLSREKHAIPKSNTCIAIKYFVKTLILSLDAHKWTHVICVKEFTLKRKLRNTDNVYTLHEYTKLILYSSSRSRFTFHEVNTEEILDFKSWWPNVHKKHLRKHKKNKSHEMKKFLLISHPFIL